MTPWITTAIKSFKKRRHHYFSLHKQNRMSKQEYNTFRNRINNEIRYAKKDYYHRLFQNIKKDVKQTWMAINRVLNSKCNKQNLNTKSLLFNNRLYTDDSGISQAFNDHFATIATKIRETVPVQGSTDGFTQYMDNFSQPNSFFLSPVTSADVEKVIMSLKNKKAPNHMYSIQSLKFISNLVSPLLSHLINKSFTCGKFPDCLKIARVTPIFKSGEKDKPDNYRPISILPVLSKIYEKIVFNQLYSYLDHFELLKPSQFGFRKNMSMSDAILNTLQYIYDNLDKGYSVVSIFLDLSKAFDCVDHEILLHKLRVYGVRGVALGWFRSYLASRQQYVTFNNKLSERRSVDCGVPQGSIPGPLLFLIVINIFPKS